MKKQIDYLELRKLRDYKSVTFNYIDGGDENLENSNNQNLNKNTNKRRSQ